MDKGMSSLAMNMPDSSIIAPSRKEIETRLLYESSNVGVSPSRRGVATWLSNGLAIEEAQQVLLLDLRKQGRTPTSVQRLEIARRRDRLQGQIDRFIQTASIYLGEAFDLADEDNHAASDLDFISESDDDACSDVRGASVMNIESRGELQNIPLPSNIGLSRCSGLAAEDLIPLEIELRQGQANDALERLRVHLSHKAILFRSVVRNAKSQSKSTRAWSQVTAIGNAIKMNAAIYNTTRKKMISLGIDTTMLRKYKPILRDDLKVSAAIADPNARGQRNHVLAWFWSVNVSESMQDNDWMDECMLPHHSYKNESLTPNGTVYRVHWLRAKSLRDRWAEEILLVKHEMHWTSEFFLRKSRDWENHMQTSRTDRHPGHECYASRQAWMYRRLAEDAKVAFQKVEMLDSK
jgi:hypothetical protein